MHTGSTRSLFFRQKGGMVGGGGEHALHQLPLEGGSALDEGFLAIEAKGVSAPFQGDVEGGGGVIVIVVLGSGGGVELDANGAEARGGAGELEGEAGFGLSFFVLLWDYGEDTAAVLRLSRGGQRPIVIAQGVDEGVGELGGEVGGRGHAFWFEGRMDGLNSGGLKKQAIKRFLFIFPNHHRIG